MKKLDKASEPLDSIRVFELFAEFPIVPESAIILLNVGAQRILE